MACKCSSGELALQGGSRQLQGPDDVDGEVIGVLVEIRSAGHTAGELSPSAETKPTADTTPDVTVPSRVDPFI
jgi:hypothetical protein